MEKIGISILQGIGFGIGFGLVYLIAKAIGLPL